MIVIDGLAGWDVNNVLYPPPARYLTEDRLENIRKSEISAINLTVSRDDYATTICTLAHALSEIDRNAGELLQVRKTADIRRAEQLGKLGIIFGFQGIHLLEGRLEDMETFHQFGVRIMQFTYNDSNAFGHGCLVADVAGGLTALGFEAMERMNGLNILPDAAHANPPTAMDIIRASKTPVTISHTGCRAIHDNPRSLPDDVLRACAERGGVVGIYMVPFLGCDPDVPTADLFMRHIEHAIDMCGEDHVSIGSDLSITPVEVTEDYMHAVRTAAAQRKAAGIGAPGEAEMPIMIPELNHADRMARIADLMRNRGHKEQVVEKILGANLLRLYEEVWQ